MKKIKVVFVTEQYSPFQIEFAEETVELNAGEMYVVPKGIQHKPYSDEECKILLVEPNGVVNTGEADSDLTASNDVWI